MGTKIVVSFPSEQRDLVLAFTQVSDKIKDAVDRSGQPDRKFDQMLDFWFFKSRFGDDILSKIHTNIPRNW